MPDPDFAFPQLKATMKRFLSFLAVALLGPIWRMPAWAQLTTLGVGGIAVVVVGILTPPSITPQPSAAFSQSNGYGFVNQGLKPNGGTAGSMELPGTCSANPSFTPTCSFALYHEFTVDPAGQNRWVLGSGNATTLGVFGTPVNSGSPTITVQHQTSGVSAGGYPWWKATVGAQPRNATNPITYIPGTNYNSGVFVWTANDGCAVGAGAREPQGAFVRGQTSFAQAVDPGFLCATGTGAGGPDVSLAAVPGYGANQSTGSGGATTCVSNSPTSSQFTVTAYVAVAHGVSPGQSFTLAGFTPSGYNETYVALPGTAGTTLVGTYSNGTGTCPGTVTAEGNTGPGSGGSLTIAAPVVSTVFTSQDGTGIQLKPGQRVCGLVGELGADSPFPGAQFAKYTDITGADLPGSPAVSPWLNMGAVNFTGYTTIGTLSPSSPALTVTAMNSFAISAASYNATTGYVTFTVAANSGIIVGTEFTVSGVSPSGYNQTYVAVAGTSRTTVVGNPLSGPIGLPQAISNPGAYVSGGSAVDVIMPGAYVPGTSPSASLIAPYGTYGSTGVGGIGTYALTQNQATFSITASGNGANQLTISGLISISPQIALGTVITSSSISGGSTTITGFVSGTLGSNGVYTTAGTLPSGSLTSPTAGPLYSSGSPGNIYAADGYYYTVTPSMSAPYGTLAAHTVANIGDFISLIGTQSSAATALVGNNAQGWGGMIANVGMFEGAPFPTSGGIPAASAMTSLCTKTTDFQSFASANGGAWRSLYKLNDPGIWADHGVAEFHGHMAGTATLTIDSTQFGSTSALAAGTVISGPGLCANSVCPTVISGSGSSYTLSASFTISSEAMSAGNYQPAAPLGTSSVTASISGSTLTVSALNTNASFTGAYSGALATGISPPAERRARSASANASMTAA